MESAEQLLTDLLLHLPIQEMSKLPEELLLRVKAFIQDKGERE